MKRTKIIDGKDIVELLVDHIRSSLGEHSPKSLSGYAMRKYRQKEFNRLYISSQAKIELLEAINDEDPFVRWCVVQALGCMSSLTSTAPLTSALKDPDEQVRVGATLELGKVSMRNAEVVEALLHVIESDTKRVKKAAVGSLRIVTGKNFLFGNHNPQKWHSYWQANKQKFSKEP